MKITYPHKTRNDFLKRVVSQLVTRRKELGLTQDDVNDLLGVADRLVSKWECGVRTPTTFHLHCWIDALNSQLFVFDKNINLQKLFKLIEQNNLVANDNEPPK